MSPFSADVGDMILAGLVTAPENQMDPKLREKVVAFRKIEHSRLEVYDFLAEISATYGEAWRRDGSAVIDVA